MITPATTIETKLQIRKIMKMQVINEVWNYLEVPISEKVLCKQDIIYRGK